MSALGPGVGIEHVTGWRWCTPAGSCGYASSYREACEHSARAVEREQTGRAEHEWTTRDDQPFATCVLCALWVRHVTRVVDGRPTSVEVWRYEGHGAHWTPTTTRPLPLCDPTGGAR